MPALNFQKRFAPLVESGEKRQTIRAYRKDGRDPKPGDTLYLYTGMRTKKCRKLGEAECKSARRIQLLDIESGERPLTVTLDSREGWQDRPVAAYVLNPFQRSDVAERDGFADASEMFAWFEKTHGLPFEGLLIRW